MPAFTWFFVGALNRHTQWKSSLLWLREYLKMVSSWILSLSPWLNGFPSHQIWSSTGNQLSAEDATPASLSLRLFVIIKANQDVVTLMTIRMRNLRTMTIAQSVILGQQKVGKLGKKQGKGCERCSRSNVMITHSSSELLTCHAKGSRPPKKTFAFK